MASEIAKQVEAIFNNERGLWETIEGGGNGTLRLNLEEFSRTFGNCPFFPCTGDVSIVLGGSKTSIDVIIRPLTLVSHLMHTVQWRKFFPCIIADELPYIPRRNQDFAAIEPETEEASVEMEASFQVLSPLVPIRKSKFTRTCCKIITPKGNEWLLFDLPEEGQQQLPFIRACKVQHSVISEASLVTWMEMAQYRQDQVPNAYLGMLGSLRWVETLAREVQRQISYIWETHDLKGTQKQLPALAQKMTRNFCLGIASATHKLSPEEEEMGVSFGTYLEDYLTAVKSKLVKGAYEVVFDYIRSLPPPPHFGPSVVQVPAYDSENYVGLYRYNDDLQKVFLKESLKDASGATLVTAPVATQMLTKKKAKTDTLAFDSFGYVLCPVGNTGRTLLTVASQLNISDPNLSSKDADWKNTAAIAINVAISQIENHFHPA